MSEEPTTLQSFVMVAILTFALVGFCYVAKETVELVIRWDARRIARHIDEHLKREGKK